MTPPIALAGLAAAFLLLAPAGAPSASSRSAVLQEVDLDAAVARFRTAAAGRDRKARTQALDGLLLTGEVEALEAVSAVLADVGEALRAARSSVEQLGHELQRKQELVKELETRAANDPSLKGSLDEQRRRREDLSANLARQEGKVADLEPWYAELRAGVLGLAPRVARGARGKFEKAQWKVAEGDEPLGRRTAAVLVLGAAGSPGTAERLHGLIADLVKERAGLQRKLPKAMRDVRELEVRMQEEARRTGGMNSFGAQYERTKAEAAALQGAITDLARLCVATARAGGRALASEPDEERPEAVEKLFKAQKKGRDGVRRYTIQLLAASSLPEVQERLFAELAAEKEPLVRALMIDALVEGRDAGGVDGERLEEHLLGVSLADPSWHVRARAAHGLAELRSKAAIPALIERLAVEEGRVRDDLGAALTSLTGQDLRGNVELWRRWWKENGEAFVVPPRAEVEQRLADREAELRGTTFFGISTESNRVLFVLDLSGSMLFSMVPRGNPEDDLGGGRQPDMPRDGERSRLQEAQLALKKAIGGMGRGGVFNVVFYASDVWTWEDSLVETSDESISDALRMVDELEAVGGTNIYGALQTALDLAGAEEGDSWSEPVIDTIYFLSDGRPSVGLTTEPDEILAFVRERNAAAGVTIHTVGLSGAQDAYLLRSLAEQNGGIYVAR